MQPTWWDWCISPRSPRMREKARIASLPAPIPRPGVAGLSPAFDDDFLWHSQETFHDRFCQDLDDTESLIMATTQRPTARRCLEDRTGEPAWKTKPSWYQVSAQDRMIPPGRLIAEADTVRAAVDLCGEGDGGHHWSVPACISVRTVRSVRDMASTCCFSSIWRGFRNRPKLSGDCPRTVSGRFWTVRDFTNFRPVRAGQRHFLDGLDASDGYTV
jgi:hypothetical protein